MGRLIRLTCAFCFVASAGFSQPVVPGAFGFGMQTRAAYACGTNPSVLRVTKLANSGSGTLRDALTASGPRVVVFEISGTIDLADQDIDIKTPCLTVAGQTAPSPGITLKGGGLSVYTHDVLIQHLRIRPGDTGARLPQTERHDASLAYSYFGPVTNVVYDHVSISWSGGKNTQVQTGSQGPVGLTYWRCIISEALYRAANVIVDTTNGDPSSLGMLLANNANQVSILQNLFAHNAARNPEIHESNVVHFINNVIYDWGKGGDKPNNYYKWATLFYSPVPGPWRVDVIGNKYIAGPPPSPDAPLVAVGTYSGDTGSQVFLKDNLLDQGQQAVTLYENRMGFDPRVSSPPVALDGLTVVPTATLEALVLAQAGARPNDRDAVDARVVTQVKTRTGRLISSQDQVGGWPDLAANRRQLTVPATPHQAQRSGYTALEEWLQGMADAVEGGGSAPPIMTAPAVLSGVRAVP